MTPPDAAERRFGGLRPSSPATALIALLLLALSVGAGGVNAALGNMAVQLFALAILAFHTSALPGFFRAGPRALALLVGASLLLPLAQLVPLPPGVWSTLPGRAMLAESLDLTGARGWYPLSLSPGRTVVAFVGTLTPLAVIAVGCALRAERLVTVQRAAIAIGLAVALFGTTHLINERWGDLYASYEAMPGTLVGTFADRNAAALFLVCCLLLLIGLPSPPASGIDLAFRTAAGAVLFVCALLTGSRTGTALLALPALLLGWRLLCAWRARAGDRGTAAPPLWAGLLALLAAALVLSTAVVSSGRVQATIARAVEGDDGMRAQMREDARYSAARYWPAGTGMGTFDEVFQIDESLEYVSPRRAARAHMDYLELAIEAGLAGIALAVAWLVWTGWAFWQSVRRPGAWPARAGGLMVAAIAAQSLLSFPLRNQAMLCVAALAVVLLARSPTLGAEPRRVAS